MVITTLYFNRWRSLAVGLASCGSGIGIFFYPQIVRTVLDRLDWHWYLQIQGAIMIVCLLAAFTFRPLTSGNGTESRTICEALASSFHIRLLKKPIFILLLLMAFLSTVGKTICRRHFMDCVLQQMFNPFSYLGHYYYYYYYYY